jgi:hypothetical protein
MSHIISSNKTVAFLLFVSLFVLLSRLPYTFVEFWTIDETGFAAVANKLCDGHVLYKEACDNKPPFIFYIYAGVFSLFGQGNMIALHWTALLFAILGLWFLHYLSAEMFTENIAKASTIAYALYLGAAPAGDVYAANTEVFMGPAIISGIYYCFLGLRNKRAWRWLAAGLLFGVGSWIKQQGILFCLMVPAVAFIDAHPFKQTSLVCALRRCVAAFLGFCAVSLFWIVFMWKDGVLREFLDMVILYNTKIQTVSVPFRQSIEMAAYTVSSYFKVHFAAILLALGGLGFIIIKLTISRTPETNKHTPAAISHRSAAILLSWLAIAILTVSLGGRFYGYYMYVLTPAMAVLIAISFDCFNRYKHRLAQLTRWSFIGFAIIGCAFPLYVYQKAYFKQTVNAYSKYKYDPDLIGFIGTPALMVSRYAAENTAFGDQIFVWGYHPYIYVLSGRDFASRYFSVALQTGFVWGTIQQMSGWATDMEISHPGSKSVFKPSDTSQWIYPGSQELLLQDLKSSPPELFIDGNVLGEWPFGAKYPIAEFPIFQEFLSNNYKLEKTIIGYRVYRRLKSQLPIPAAATASSKVS